jgi:hypothetical protein
MLLYEGAQAEATRLVRRGAYPHAPRGSPTNRQYNRREVRATTLAGVHRRPRAAGVTEIEGGKAR